MRAAVVRELIVVARRPAFTIATCAYVGLLVAFLLLWSGGVPLLAPSNLYEQQRALAWVLIATLLPWTGVRCLAPDRGDHLVSVCVVGALRPSAIVQSKVIALSGCLMMVVIAGVPAALFAQQMSAAPAKDVLRDMGAMFGAATLIAAASVAWMLFVRDRLVAWLGAALSIGLSTAAICGMTGGAAAGVTSLMLAVAVTLFAAGASDRSFRYCDD